MELDRTTMMSSTLSSCTEDENAGNEDLANKKDDTEKGAKIETCDDDKVQTSHVRTVAPDLVVAERSFLEMAAMEVMELPAPAPQGSSSSSHQPGAHAVVRPGFFRFNGRNSHNNSLDISVATTTTRNNNNNNNGLVEAELVVPEEVVIAEQWRTLESLERQFRQSSEFFRVRKRYMVLASGCGVILVAGFIVAVVLAVIQTSTTSDTVQSFGVPPTAQSGNAAAEALPGTYTVNSGNADEAHGITLDSTATSSRCFQSTQELSDAVDEYYIDNRPNSNVSQHYGWPIGTWCVSEIRDFSVVLSPFQRDQRLRSPEVMETATQFHEDIGDWDMSRPEETKEVCTLVSFRGVREFVCFVCVSAVYSRTCVGLFINILDATRDEECIFQFRAGSLEYIKLPQSRLLLALYRNYRRP